MRQYLPSAEIRRKRIRCPFHQGQDFNLALYQNRFKCFVCGESGDVISFVMKLQNIDFKETCAQLDRDFNLGLHIGESRTLRQAYDAQKRCEEAAKEREKAEAERAARERAYEAALDRYVQLDKARLFADPNSAEYAHAVQWIDAAKYELDNLDIG